MTSCNMVERYRRLGRTCCFHIQPWTYDSTLLETSVTFYHTIWRHIQKGSCLQILLSVPNTKFCRYPLQDLSIKISCQTYCYVIGHRGEGSEINGGRNVLRWRARTLLRVLKNKYAYYNELHNHCWVSIRKKTVKTLWGVYKDVCSCTNIKTEMTIVSQGLRIAAVLCNLNVR